MFSCTSLFCFVLWLVHFAVFVGCDWPRRDSYWQLRETRPQIPWKVIKIILTRFGKHLSGHVSLHPTKTREKTVLVKLADFPKIIADFNILHWVALSVTYPVVDSENPRHRYTNCSVRKHVLWKTVKEDRFSGKPTVKWVVNVKMGYKYI